MSTHDFTVGSVVFDASIPLFHVTPTPPFSGVTTTTIIPPSRSERQHAASKWAADAFNGGQLRSLRDSAMRCLEEAIELAQAAGVGQIEASRMLRHVYDKPAGEVRLELGQVGLTLLTVAESAGLDADVAERWEVDRVMSKPLSRYTARYEAKKAAGVG